MRSQHMMRARPTATTAQEGMTLVEVLVALTVSLVLLTGVIQIMLSSKQTYRIQEGTARLQENGRFAAQFLADELRMTGFSGCSSGLTPNNIADLDGDGTPDNYYNFTADGLQGFEYADLPIVLTAAESLTPADVLNNTDVVVMMYGSTNEYVQLDGNLAAMNANIQLTPTNMFAPNDILMISDCTNADIFAATNVANGLATTTIAHAAATNTDVNLSKAYRSDAVVMSFVKSAYYVGTNAAGVPALFRKRMVGANVQTEELVEGVENLQILYGEDTDGDNIANRYANADNVADFSNVVSVRFAMLVRTPEEVSTELDTKTYTLLDTVVDPVDDRRLRRIFSITVNLRNRSLG
ncbi:MAG TPA: prepilin-type N-terminal cleavage/methylation domain-containing protein [Gammaproteobacteria bacterium]|nr:prepilin-type N-terminal cleavage/methylation domain-containing protein [Gammaproteobacteria bacterium]